MKYEIEKGDRFKCIKDYIMDSGEIAYIEGKEYISELNGCLTDNGLDYRHKIVEEEEDFFEYFVKAGEIQVVKSYDSKEAIKFAEWCLKWRVGYIDGKSYHYGGMSELYTINGLFKKFKEQ